MMLALPVPLPKSRCEPVTSRARSHSLTATTAGTLVPALRR